MDRKRADLGFAAALDEPDPTDGFDLSEWAPDPAARPRPAAEETRSIAARTGFRSREAGQGAKVAAPVSEPEPAAPPKPVRRRRTGRNAQFNLKARPETIAAFCDVADRQGWGLGETLEYAVALLQRDYSD